MLIGLKCEARGRERHAKKSCRDVRPSPSRSACAYIRYSSSSEIRPSPPLREYSPATVKRIR
eukprot:3088454-Rhodomonas_salina.1